MKTPHVYTAVVTHSTLVHFTESFPAHKSHSIQSWGKKAIKEKC